MKYWFPVIVWIGIIFWMSTAMFTAQNTSSIVEPILRFLFPSRSHREIEHLHFVIRKLAHLTEYFISGLLLFRAFRSGSDERHAGRWVLYSFIVLVLLASSDEYHQSFVGGRSASIVDVGIDAIGGIAALAISTLKRWFKQNA
ncbi:MAG TPA: VanZ family protein [Bacteroidota bacterium]|nr:VanZ family protein [Bacteroidota bacterium]